MADLTLATKSNRTGVKAILGRTYITFNFGNSTEGEVMANTFAGIWKKVGQERILELICNDYKSKK